MALFRILLLQLLAISIISGQTIITGLVTDKDDLPIIGANVYIENTYDGGITDENGSFQFISDEKGEKTLVISYLGYETKKYTKDVTRLVGLNIKLYESIHTLDAVVISASTFKAGENSSVSALKPLDILTTAGSVGDVIGALQTLPGTQTNADDGRLFVRGGEARETNIYVDGLRVFAPYMRTVNGSPTRGRYSPQLFKGVSFSTGGYSPAYGQALSGILEMNTTDDVKETETNLSIMSLGLGLGHSQQWDNQSMSVNMSYTNLTPYNWIFPDRINWTDPYSGFSGEGVYRYQTDHGLIKSYIAGDISQFALLQNNLDNPVDDVVAIQNKNIYTNSSYFSVLTDKTSIKTGFSLGWNNDDLSVNESLSKDQKLNGFHGRIDVKTILNRHIILNYGLDHLRQSDGIRWEGNQNFLATRSLTGSYIESDYFFSKNIAIKMGVRGEYHNVLEKFTIDPRITIGGKISENSQLSVAYGSFTQEVSSEVVPFYPELQQEKSRHFIINYNYKTHKQMARMEVYYKSYDNLITYQEVDHIMQHAENSGHGRAFGVDLFYRLNQVIENVDMWISYSWIDHHRLYKDFPTTATPYYSPAHNLSLVSKIWIPGLRSQCGITFNFASGRPYENPNNQGFLNERSSLYKQFNLSWAYLLSQQNLLFLSLTNVTGFNNEFGYRYTSNPDSNGIYPGEIIRPNADQFLFIGFFATLSADKTKNQLDNL